MNLSIKQNMKNVSFLVVLVALFASSAFSQEKSSVETADAARVKKYDINGNGKIDVEERRDYVREIAKQRRQDAKKIAAERPKLSRQERLFYEVPGRNPQIVRQFDANKNGKLDVSEQIEAQRDAGNKARAEFQRHDKNSDGKLDEAELKAAKLPPLRPRHAPVQRVIEPDRL